jgi:hypothetical protein
VSSLICFDWEAVYPETPQAGRARPARGANKGVAEAGDAELEAPSPHGDDAPRHSANSTAQSNVKPASASAPADAHDLF